jgi:hypothetical protein
MKYYESIVDALNDLKDRGYYADFTTDTVCLYCGELDIRLNPEEFQVDEVYRFEGDSNPDDSAVLYAITSSTGLKGTLIDAYGVYAKSLSFDMAKKLQYHPVET